MRLPWAKFKKYFHFPLFYVKITLSFLYLQGTHPVPASAETGRPNPAYSAANLQIPAKSIESGGIICIVM